MKPAIRPGPLGDKELVIINTNMRALHDLNPHLDRAEACGIDCSEHRDVARQYLDLYQKIKQQYFPGEP